MAPSSRFAWLAASAVLFVAACAASGADTFDNDDDDGISSGSTGGSTGTGGSGGSPGCFTPSECPGEDTDCTKRTCDDGTCGERFEAERSACDEDGGTYCDGNGACVECTLAEHCNAGVCNNGVCIEPSCTDGVFNGEETDLDCGGPCSGCDIGEMCNEGTDCLSGYCDMDTSTCAPCTGHTDCPAGQFCDGTNCVDLLANGSPCTEVDQCASGFCPDEDGVCCDAACDMGCESCSMAATQMADGVCSPTVECINDDGCCPTGCDDTNDTDCAIVDLDVGTHNSTYSSSVGTRGMWFVAPVDFTIRELRVPLEVGSGQQNLQVVRFTAAPPDYSASTTAFTTLHYSTGSAGSAYVVVDIPVSAGDIIGILGARGTSTMATSYGTNPYTTMVNGQPMTLNRLVYQANVGTTQAGPLSNENGGSIGRVEMRYSP